MAVAVAVVGMAIPAIALASHPAPASPEQGGGASRPSAPTPSIDGADPRMDGQTLTGNPGPADGTQTSEWIRCSSAAADATCVYLHDTDNSYTLTPADVGSVIRYRVRHTNPTPVVGGFREADAVTGVIQPAPPARQTGPFVTGTAREGQTLQANPGEWDGTPPITFTYQWERCQADFTGCEDVPGATGTSYVLTAADVGRRLRVGVTANNAAPGTSAEEDSNFSAVVVPLPPDNTALPDIRGTQREGEVLTSTTGAWTSSRPITYSYEWQRCFTVCTPIAGATGSSYRLTGEDVGKRVAIKVTARNSGGASSATDITGTISRKPPFPDFRPAEMRQLSPFPVIVIAGRVRGAQTSVSQLQIRNAPRRALVTIRCRGRTCPYSRQRRRVRRNRIRIRGLERNLRAGTTITILVRKGRTFGKYTRFRIRRGAPPARVDGCVRPGSIKRARCPRSPDS